MKKTFIFATFFLLLFSFSAFSQEVHLGIKAGSDIHKITGKSFDEEFSFGYHAGAFLEVKLKKIGIQPEVYFSQVNTKNGTDVNSVLNGVDNDIKLSYLNIPLLVNIKFSNNVAFQLGPQYSILVNEDQSAVQNGKEAFKNGDFSVNGGIQVKILKIRLYGRFNVGLTNVNDINNTEKWKNRTIHVGAAYSFL